MTTRTPNEIAFELAQEWRDHRDHIVFTEATLITALREAIEADRAQRAEAAAYKVGDPDPTPDDWEDREQCAATHDGFVCTWHAGHSEDVPHVAGDGEEIAEVWR